MQRSPHLGNSKFADQLRQGRRPNSPSGGLQQETLLYQVHVSKAAPLSCNFVGGYGTSIMHSKLACTACEHAVGGCSTIIMHSKLACTARQHAVGGCGTVIMHSKLACTAYEPAVGGCGTIIMHSKLACPACEHVVVEEAT